MSTAVANSPTEHYAAERAAGCSHAEAVRRTAHAYSRTEREMGARLDRARAEWEASQHPEPEPHTEPEPAPATTDDPLGVRLGEIHAKIATLDRERASLCLDALTDTAKRTRLGKVETEIAKLRADAEHVELAQAEQARRERADAEETRRRAVDDALQRAAELGADRMAAAERVDDALKAVAVAMAEHQAVAHAQLAALGEAGYGDNWRQVLPSDDAIRRAVVFAVTAGGAPAGWLERPTHAELVHAAPLAESDNNPNPPKEN